MACHVSIALHRLRFDSCNFGEVFTIRFSTDVGVWTREHKWRSNNRTTRKPPFSEPEMTVCLFHESVAYLRQSSICTFARYHLRFILNRSSNFYRVVEIIIRGNVERTQKCVWIICPTGERDVGRKGSTRSICTSIETSWGKNVPRLENTRIMVIFCHLA